MLENSGKILTADVLIFLFITVTFFIVGSLDQAKKIVLPSSPSLTMFEKDEFNGKSVDSMKTDSSEKSYKIELAWRNIIYFSILHLASLYGIYLIFASAKVVTTLFAFFLYVISGLGITAGAHRLWSHRAYKATWQLRLILMLFNSTNLQGYVLSWARDHRVHHKYSDTDADPYNSKRGFFFAHIGWLMCRKHPDVKDKGKGIDMSDLYADPILRFQKKYYWTLMPLCCFVLPTIIPVYCWNESWINALCIPAILRVTLVLQATFCVNSIAHFYGYKPYDRNIRPVDNLPVAIISGGEGWHNYHHAFPWDYRTSELKSLIVNFTLPFIDLCSWLGWAYDLKIVSTDIIKKRVQRTGDGSHELWGWGDKDISKDDEIGTVITSAVCGLLNIGPNASITDAYGQTAFFDAMDAYNRSKGDDRYEHMEVVQTFLTYLRFLELCEIPVIEANVAVKKRALENCTVDTEKISRFQEQIEKAKVTKVGKVALGSFLSETEAVNVYFDAPQSDRCAVDVFFQTIDESEFDEVKCILNLHYRKIVAKKNLIG